MAESCEGQFRFANRSANLWALAISATPGNAFVFAKANTIRLQLPRQPFMAVHIDLDRHGKPGLNTDMDQTEVTIHEVEVQVQTLPPCCVDEGTLTRLWL